MLVNELFNQPGAWKWVEALGDYVEGEFTVGNQQYLLMLTKMDLDPETVDAEFAMYNFSTGDIDDVWTVEFGMFVKGQPMKYDMTKTGNAAQVFATVVAMMQEFKQKRPSAAFFFTAKEQSRRSFYDAIARRLGTKPQMVPSPFPSGSRGYLIT